jgi:uncharacterized protein (TIGR03437 family)
MKLCLLLLTCAVGSSQALPAPSIKAVVNAASGLTGAIAPGEEVSIYGTDLGPTGVLAAQILNGSYPTLLGNTQVLFGGIAAPIIAVTNGQVNAMVPFEIAGQDSIPVQVVYAGAVSAVVNITVTVAAIGIYTVDQSGTGQALAVCQNGSINGPDNLADGYIQLYVTGLGVTSPASATGQIAPVDGSSFDRSLLQLTAYIGGVSTGVEYAGAAPGFVNGVAQINIDIPANAPSGNVPLTISGLDLQSPFTFAFSQPGVTLWIR